MTKEEILRLHYNEIFGFQKYNTSVNRKMIFEYVSPAMDEYAKQQGVAFAEWIAARGYENIGENEWKVGHVITRTTRDLYSIFIEHQNKQA